MCTLSLSLSLREQGLNRSAVLKKWTQEAPTRNKSSQNYKQENKPVLTHEIQRTTSNRKTNHTVTANNKIKTYSFAGYRTEHQM